ncbi:hypothetical protein KC865_04510 [Candidatus Kaiserbacteria bacterium]|nr:hypothetical protein [Candidatus Kaiserbacteria bacterium]USN92671.1 MAG: hypothetical protein H6782_02565 [Candidatus Nomurabacteria bacterium]
MKALLLDADGVVLGKGEYFSDKFAREHNVQTEDIMSFFRGPFGDCQAGKKDLKIELKPFLERWGWKGTVEDFLDYWFEDVSVDPDIERVVDLYRSKGVKCYMASNNEAYRARRIEKVLGDRLDGYFFSADLKAKKDNPEFFTRILDELDLPGGEIGFVDNEQKNVDVAKEIGIDARLYSKEILEEFLRESGLTEFKNELK